MIPIRPDFTPEYGMDRPCMFYQYRSLSKASAAHTLDILENSRFWASSAESFNDPYEGRFTIDYRGFRKNRSDEFIKYVINKANLNIPYNEQDLTGNMARYFESFRIPFDAINKKVDEQKLIFFQQRLRETTGVVCFSRKPNDILMWGHYADCHSGICLGFDQVEESSVFDEIKPVVYQHSHPVWNYLAIYPFEDCFLTKSTEWAYESEARLIRWGNARKHVEFPKTALRQIIVGQWFDRNDEETGKKVINFAIKNGIEIYMARLRYGYYGLDLWRLYPKGTENESNESKAEQKRKDQSP